MAIEFARPRFIQRSKGHNVVQVAGYNMRERLYCELTGQRSPKQDPNTHVYHEIMLPAGANSRFAEAEILWNAAQAAEHRKNSQEAFEVVLPLPANQELTSNDRLELARSFAQEHWVSRGLAVQIDVHNPHSTDTSEWRNMLNGGAAWHAHILVTTRRIEGDHLNHHKARDLQPKVRMLPFGKPIVAEGELWGVAWRDHQNAWFEANGKGITVDPVGPIPQEHIGPVRFRHPRDPRIAANEQVRALNVKIASDPRLHNLQREALEKASWADKVQSGLRPLSVEDVARELSIKDGRREPNEPTYAELLDQAKQLREDARNADWIRLQQTADKEAGEHRVNERWSEMGIARRALHLVGSAFPSVSVLRDLELERWSSLNKQGARAEERWSIRSAAISGGAFGAPAGDLQVVMRQAAMELDKIRPQAEQELERRQKIARNARAALENLDQRDKLIRRARRSISM